MSSLGSRAMTMGFTVMLLSVSTAMHLGADAFGSLLCFVGVLVGASLIAAGVRMADDPAPLMAPIVFDGTQALVAFLRRNTVAVGLVMVSSAVAMVSGEEDSVLCFGMFLLLLLGLTLINIGARGQ